MAARKRRVWVRRTKNRLVLLKDDLITQEHQFLWPSFQTGQKTTLLATRALNTSKIGKQKGKEIT